MAPISLAEYPVIRSSSLVHLASSSQDSQKWCSLVVVLNGTHALTSSIVPSSETDRKVSFGYGARSFRKPSLGRLRHHSEENENFVWHLALSDVIPEDDWENPESAARQPLGSQKGYTGFIHQVLLDNYLKDHEAPEDCEFYICGPPMMNQAVIDMLDNLGVEPENILMDDFGG